MTYKSPLEIFMRASIAGAFIIPAFFLAPFVRAEVKPKPKKAPKTKKAAAKRKRKKS